MSTAVIAGIIIVGLAVLVAIAIATQTIEKTNKEKRRLESALNARARNFEYMLSGFPEGFLNKDLKILVCNCLEEVFSQLVRIKPKNKDYRNSLSEAQQQLTNFSALPASTSAVTLTDPAQIKEVQNMLSGLYSFIAKLAASKRINTEEAKIYGKQIRRLMLQTSVDAFIEPIREALNKGKHRLAIHYLHMANDKMKKENDDGFYNERIDKQTARIKELEQQASEIDGSTEATAEPDSDEWDELQKPDNSWKKKALYD